MIWRQLELQGWTQHVITRRSQGRPTYARVCSSPPVSDGNSGQEDLAGSDEPSRPFLAARSSVKYDAAATIHSFTIETSSTFVAPGRDAELTMFNTFATTIGLQIGSGIIIAPS